MESKVHLWILLLCALIQSAFTESECNIGNCLYGEDYCVSERGCLYGCQPGYSGQHCDRTCSSGCIECRWDGHSETCTMCRPGKYGPGCTESCSSHCRINQTKCDHFGHCIYGCKLGWRGDKCDEQDCDFENCLRCDVVNKYIYCSNCTTGKFWNITAHSCVNCSNFCKGGSQACNTTTGVCLHGCQPGYFGFNCDKGCVIEHCNECRERVFSYTSNQVYCQSCDDGYYARDNICVSCTGNCVNGEFCDRNTGKCINGCAPGWYDLMCDRKCMIENCTQCVSQGNFNPPTCKQCDAGFYQNKDSCKECSPHCKGGQLACNNSDGSCTQGCQFGYYGLRCEFPCSNNCFVPGLCDENGHCIGGCQPGSFGPQCDRRCPPECSECNIFVDTGKCPDCLAGWYGALCDQRCSPYCKRNIYSNYLHCHKDNGSCVDGCIAGHYGDNCNLTCSENCPLKECYRGNGKCKYPCSSTRFGEYCEKKCPENCKFRSADKLSCNEITLMCVYGCNDGFFGDYCNKTCPSNCKNNQCDRVSGMCRECAPGFFGPSCGSLCPSNCKNGLCHFEDGYCSGGCNNNMFGRNCSSVCSAWCVGGTCFHQNGYCDQGCLGARYGMECDNVCSSKCMDSLCDQLSGRCSKGCMEGWFGEKCDFKCTLGSFGPNCDHACGKCINNQVCDYRDGACPLGCAEGWTGDTCHIALRTSENLGEKNTDTMAIAGSVTAAILLTVLTIVIVTIIVRRKHMHLCSTCSKPQKSSDPLEGQGHSPETYGFQMDVGTAIRNADRDLLNTETPRDFELDRESLQVFTEVSLHQMPLDFSLHNGEYKHHSVLIKCLHKERDRNQMIRFRNELDILRSLSDVSRNIFILYGHCEDQKYEYSVFEKCDNGNLKQHLKQLRYSSQSPASATFAVKAPELISYALDVLLGIIFLKERKIIHRLGIPMNVYLFSQKRAKLANFYFAINSSMESEPEPVPRKYYPWLAVESKRKKQYSNESEVWTYGVLLLEIVCLGYPFPEEENEFYLMPPKSCDRKLLDLMESCWRLSPASRPSCQELLSQLKAIRQNLEVNQGDDSAVMTTMV
uniref:Multiple epidermal growth factor-like domains protein 6 isoform X2 n=1 Tax=Crassostrea virginica TaxID=6565 RepID=A0A8B8CP09_CRAVI|nr:multiple epidermal growth factor-like domains protein 6 isoform X2 [Crassostrea virginica]